MQEYRFATIDGLLTKYSFEEGDKIVLFLHGWGGNLHSLDIIANRLNCGKIKVDLWSFGCSQEPFTPLSVMDYAHKIKKLLDLLGVMRVSIVAHSFGCRLAVILAAQYPDLVDRTVLLGAAGLRRFSLKRSLAISLFKLKKLARRLGILSAIKGGSEDYNRLSPVMRESFKLIINKDLSHFARNVLAPTVLIYGENDRDTPLWMMKKYNRLISDSAAFVIPKASHYCFLDNPNAVIPIVKALLFY